MTSLHVLIVEDSEDDFELILLALRRGEFNVTHQRIETAFQLREALTGGSWDLALSDYTLPELNAPAALAIVREIDPDLPFVVVSGTIGEEIASDLLRIGANDYLLKSSLVRLESIVRRELDATKQRRSHRAAEVAARQLAAIVQSSDDAIIARSHEGLITSWNPAAERLYGWSREEALGQSISLIVPPERAEELERVMQGLQAGRQVPSFETVRIRKDGTQVPVAITISPIRDEAGQLIGASITARDLSAFKKTEALLMRDALILGNVRDAVVVTGLEGTVTYWNEGATRLFGVSAEEMVGRPYLHRLPEAIRRWFSDERSRSQGAEWSGEYEDSRGDGTPVWLNSRVTLVSDASGQPVGLLALCQEVTERRRAEDALKQREAEYRALAENLPQMVWVTDAAGEIQYLNRKWTEFTGRTLEETDQWQWVEVVHPDDRASTLDKWRTALRMGTQYETEFRLRHADGQFRWHLVHAVPVRGSDGSILRWIGTCMDLEAHKQELLTQAQLAAIVEASHDMIISTTPEGLIRTWNSGAEKALGFTAAEMIGRSLGVLGPPGSEPSPEALQAKVLQGEPVADVITTRIRKDGGRRQFSLTLSPIRDAEGRVLGAAGISRDITEQLNAAAALRESEERFRAFMDNCPAAAFIKDEEGRLLYVNEAWRRQFEPEPIEWEGKTDFDFWPPETAALFRASDQQCLRSGQSLQSEETGLLPGRNEQRHWLVMKFPLGLPGERRVGGMAWDVTDRKRAEEGLRESEERYRQLADAMPQIVWVARRDGSNEFANLRWYVYTGLTDEQTKEDGWLDVFHPDDQPTAMEKWRLSQVTGEPFETEYRCRRHDGIYRWFLGRALPHRDADGGILRWFGTATDIHEFKTAEALLRDREAKLAEAARMAGMGHWSRNLTTGAIEWSDHLYEVFKVERREGEQTLDWFLQMVHPDDREKVCGYLSRVEKQCGLFEHLYRIRTDAVDRVIHEVGQVFVDRKGIPCRIAGTAQDVTERVRAEEALQLRDRAIRAVTQGIVITDPIQADNPIVYASPGFEQLTGYSLEESAGRNCRFLQGSDTDPEALARLRKCIENAEVCTVELLNYRKDGTPFWNELSVSPVRDEQGKVTNFVGVISDVTRRRQLEEQLRQAQKMEGVGRLAGGIAHDFNNMLAVINGYSELVCDSLQPGHLRDYVGEVLKAGQRAANLTRQLLAFSRRQILAPKVLDLDRALVDLDKMLRRLIGEDIELVTVATQEPLWVKADPGQLEQVLVNLVVNARDAMPTGGTLTITAEKVHLDEAALPNEENVHPGPYILLSVSDTGTGIAPESLAHIFEPFYTTKEVGKGTGLGLSTVYGIVRQSGGFIHVASQTGKGSRFSVYLPQSEAPATYDQPAAPILAGGNETILLVEDEPMLRAMMVQMLRQCGYTVLEALQGDDALRAAGDYAGKIDLLVTDVVMPRMSGITLADEMLSRHPEVAVLFISGYTDDDVLRYGVQSRQLEFLQKPFGMRELAQRIRRVLDQKAAMKGRGTILVIDDSDDPQEALAAVLREEGYVAITAANGREGLSLLEQEPLPDVIILDLVMPGMNGWVFRQEQLKAPRLREIPTIVLSGHVDPLPTADFLQPEAALRKPVELDELLKIIRQCLPREAGQRGGDQPP